MQNFDVTVYTKSVVLKYRMGWGVLKPAAPTWVWRSTCICTFTLLFSSKCV